MYFIQKIVEIGRLYEKCCGGCLITSVTAHTTIFRRYKLSKSPFLVTIVQNP